MAFESINYLLLYFIRDKTVAIYSKAEVKLWNLDTYTKFKSGDRVFAEAEYDCVLEKVRILQAAEMYTDLEETRNFVVALKFKKIRLEEIITHFKPIRTSGRQHLPPLSRYFVNSEDSTDMEASMPVESVLVQTRHREKSILPCLDPLPPAPASPLSNTSQPSPFNPRGSSTLLGRTTPQRTSVPAKTQHANTSNNTNSPFTTPQTAVPIGQQSVKICYEKLLDSCRSQGFQIEPFNGVFHGLASIMVEQCRLSGVVASFGNRLTTLETRVAGINLPAAPTLQKFPVFNSIEEYMDVENHSQDLKWMKREGGDSIKDHVSRVLNKLIAPDIQSKINRPGFFKKEKFHTFLEDGVKASVMSLFPASTSKEVEKLVSRFFNGARDRNGGCEERRRSATLRDQQPVSNSNSNSGRKRSAACLNISDSGSDVESEELDRSDY